MRDFGLIGRNEPLFRTEDDLIADVLLETLLDTLKVLPYLFFAYLLLEILERKTEEKNIEAIGGSGKWGPVVGSLLGLVPQCGLSAASANFYAGGVITRGTMLAVFLSTSDEMLPIFLSRSAPLGFIAKVLLVKLIAGFAAGTLVDAAERRLGHRRHLAIHELCEQEGCECEHGVLRSALYHTAKITLFLLVTTFLVGLLVESIGEDAFAGFLLDRPVAGSFLAGLIGFIPNCASSIIICELYLRGGLGAGALLSGLLVGSGIGVLVLFRMNRNLRDNLITAGLLYGFGVAFGMAAGALPMFG